MKERLKKNICNLEDMLFSVRSKISLLSKKVHMEMFWNMLATSG